MTASAEPIAASGGVVSILFIENFDLLATADDLAVFVNQATGETIKFTVAENAVVLRGSAGKVTELRRFGDNPIGQKLTDGVAEDFEWNTLDSGDEAKADFILDLLGAEHILCLMPAADHRKFMRCQDGCVFDVSCSGGDVCRVCKWVRGCWM